MGRKSNQLCLQVYLNGEHIGTVMRRASGGTEFAYTKEWVQADGSIPISQSMPLREPPYRGASPEGYFDNLLPDNDEIRRKLAERITAKSKRPLDLLAVIGRDCVGALQFIPEGESLPQQEPIRGEKLTDYKIGRLLRNLKIAPLGLEPEQEFRISIAGAQEKTALLYWKRHWYRPKGSTPTTHILKPPMGKLPNGIDMSQSVQNEWLSLKLAEHFGLTVAKAEMDTFDGIDCLVIERFDRRWSSNKKQLLRIPQEDLCQALGIPWTRKYESEGGPGIVRVMGFLNASDYRERDRMQFIRAQLIFFLLGAIDGHAKNFSITLLPTGFCLAPVYDVMTAWPLLEARQIEPKQAKLAMAVGDRKHYRLSQIQKRHWEQTAKRTGYPTKELESLMEDLQEGGRNLDDLGNRLIKKVPEKLVTTVTAQIKNQLSKLN